MGITVGAPAALRRPVWVFAVSVAGVPALPTYRAPMVSRRDDVDAAAAVSRALRLGVCGVGGRVTPAPSLLDEAIAAVERTHDERMARRLARFADAPDGAHVWTRDGEGWFWHGVLQRPWRYDNDAEAHEVDLVHVRACRWDDEPVALSDLPDAVQHTFARGGRNWQRIRAAGGADGR